MIKVGKSEKGKIFHSFVGNKKTNHAACDKRQTGLLIDATLDARAITCAKCLLRAEVKEAILHIKESKPAIDDVKPSVDKEAVGLPTAPPKKKLDVTAEVTTSKKKTSTTTTSKEEEEEIITDDGDFYAKVKKDGRFEIHHSPTGKRFFDSVPEEVVLDAIIKMNAIEERWKQGGSLPKDFISKCRQALRDAYSENNKTVPKSLLADEDEKKKPPKKKVEPKSKTVKFKKGDRITSEVDGKEVEMEYDGKTFVLVKVGDVKPAKKKIARRKKPDEKEKRVIKRRGAKPEAEKKAKRKIKRRSEEDTLLGRSKGTPGYTVVEMLMEGATMAQLVGALKIRHKMDPKKAWTKIRAVIRKTARRQSVPVVIVMQDSEPGHDYYTIEPKKK